MPGVQRATWGIAVQSLARGERLFDLNPQTLMVPASVAKLVSVATAVDAVGWDYRFTTTLRAGGPVDGGVLRGDLIVVGSGDPAIGGRGGDDFAGWIDALKAAGIHRIEVFLALAGLVLLAVSLSWSMAVDLTPATARPYVSDSGTNSELSLALGYNGLGRVTTLLFGGLTSLHLLGSTIALNIVPAFAPEIGDPSPWRLLSGAVGEGNAVPFVEGRPREARGQRRLVRRQHVHREMRALLEDAEAAGPPVEAEEKIHSARSVVN